MKQSQTEVAQVEATAEQAQVGRRRFVYGATAVAATGFLAACSKKDDAAPSVGAPAVIVPGDAIVLKMQGLLGAKPDFFGDGPAVCDARQ